jgi:hypothetical protein
MPLKRMLWSCRDHRTNIILIRRGPLNEPRPFRCISMPLRVSPISNRARTKHRIERWSAANRFTIAIRRRVAGKGNEVNAL